MRNVLLKNGEIVTVNGCEDIFDVIREHLGDDLVQAMKFEIKEIEIDLGVAIENAREEGSSDSYSEGYNEAREELESVMDETADALERIDVLIAEEAIDDDEVRKMLAELKDKILVSM